MEISFLVYLYFQRYLIDTYQYWWIIDRIYIYINKPIDMQHYPTGTLTRGRVKTLGQQQRSTTSTKNFYVLHFSQIPQNNTRLKLSYKFGELNSWFPAIWEGRRKFQDLSSISRTFVGLSVAPMMFPTFSAENIHANHVFHRSLEVLKLDSNRQFFVRVTLKFDERPRKIIRHVFYTTSKL